MGRVNFGNILGKVLLVLYIAAVAALCFLKFPPTNDIPHSFLGIATDKIVHFCMFLPFSVLVYWAFEMYGHSNWSRIAIPISLFLLGCFMAWGTEFIQGFLPYRTSDPLDLKADAMALAVSSFVVLIVEFIRK